MQTGDLYVPLLVWIAFNCFFTLAAVILVVFVSGVSGIIINSLRTNEFLGKLENLLPETKIGRFVL